MNTVTIEDGEYVFASDGVAVDMPQEVKDWLKTTRKAAHKSMGFAAVTLPTVGHFWMKAGWVGQEPIEEPLDQTMYWGYGDPPPMEWI